MKSNEILRILGFGIYMIFSIVNRFITPIPDVVFIPIAVVSIGLIIAGLVVGKKNK